MKTDTPKKYQIFKGIEPDELLIDDLHSYSGRVVIRTVSAKFKWGTFLTGAMTRENAKKLIADYRKYLIKKAGV